MASAGHPNLGMHEPSRSVLWQSLRQDEARYRAKMRPTTTVRLSVTDLTSTLLNNTKVQVPRERDGRRHESSFDESCSPATHLNTQTSRGGPRLN